MAKFHELIPEHELWNVLDASKAQDFSRCRRFYFFRHILGWRSVNESNIHLEFGTAAHFAMEVLAEQGYTGEACSNAFKVFMEHYRKFFPPEADEHNKPKTPENFLRALPQYCARYHEADKDNEILHVETAGSVNIGDNKTMHFKIDTIGKGPMGYFSLEHKTSAYYGDRWRAGWVQKIQVGVYSHVLYSLYPENEVYGVIINGIFLSEPPRIRKDGQPYAGAKDNEFHRVPARFSPQQLQAWILDMHDLIQDRDRQQNQLMDADEDDPILRAYPRNREACTQYGVCPYLEVCSSNMNPVKGVNYPPIDYEVTLWDPRNIPTVKERMDLP
jgi:hypothetical protein